MGNIAQIKGTQELPARFEALQNGRWRLTRRWSLQTGGNIDDAAFEALGVALSAEYTPAADEAKFTNLKLISVGGGGNAEPGPVQIVAVYETLTGTFVAEVDDATDYELNGLKRVSRVLIAQAGTSVAAFVVGVQAYGSGYLAKLNVEENDAWVRVRAEYLDPGVVSRTIRLLDGGLREETVNSFYTKEIPAGIVTFEREENEEGYPVWSVTAMQSATGGDPITGAVLQSSTGLRSFDFPGRAKLYETLQTVLTVYEFTYINVYMDPPLRVLVDATTEVSYQDTDAIGSLTNPLWNPLASATLRSVYVTTLAGIDSERNGARSKVQGLPGYRAANGTDGATESLTINFESTVSGGGTVAEIAVPFGETVHLAPPGLIGGEATLEGGPEQPDGNTYTLEYAVSPAFMGVDGTQYYRKTVVYATIPTQPALPV